jgi:hypothetical protein
MKALEEVRRSKSGAILVLPWYKGEPRPQKPEGFNGLFVTIRKPEPREAHQ